ncbi:MAG: hypothetical protein M1543_03690, partial [Firmicutes bacterium]|nr:hypothetical protein [Bacillota bacterium]
MSISRALLLFLFISAGCREQDVQNQRPLPAVTVEEVRQSSGDFTHYGAGGALGRGETPSRKVCLMISL